jgi:hypothetical protein
MHQTATPVRWTRRLVLLSLALASVLVPAAVAAADTAPSSTPPEAGAYLGKWNYDQPDRATGINIAEVDIPGAPRMVVPQIGDIVFRSAGDGRVTGFTDIGCTWLFRVAASSLELDPAAQLCRNALLHVSYTVTRYTVTVAGTHMQEFIRATAHLPQAESEFILAKGARTRTREYDPPAAAQFIGTWAYDPADPAGPVNIRITQYPQADGTTQVVNSPEQGEVTITHDFDNRITAHTSDGCTWSMLARGNTAKLDPPLQTCTRASSAAITIRYWTIASDGQRQSVLITGTDERGGDFVLNPGSLTRR